MNDRVVSAFVQWLNKESGNIREAIEFLSEHSEDFKRVVDNATSPHICMVYSDMMPIVTVIDGHNDPMLTINESIQISIPYILKDIDQSIVEKFLVERL